MKLKSIAGLVCALGVSAAFAHGCPGEMRAIDAKLPAVSMAEGQMTKVKELRARGEQLHKDGKHAESMAALAEAKKLLGL